MKKKILKICATVCVLALIISAFSALCACKDKSEENGVAYTYSECKIQMDNSDPTSLEHIYDAMNENSTISVTDSKILWKFEDMEQSMTVTKNGDKYSLSGEYCEQMKESMSSMGYNVATYEMYGLQTEAGFDIVLELVLAVVIPGYSSNYNMTCTFSFI